MVGVWGGMHGCVHAFACASGHKHEQQAERGSSGGAQQHQDTNAGPAAFAAFDYEGLGNCPGKAEAYEPSAYGPAKQKGMVHVMDTSHGAGSTTDHVQSFELLCTTATTAATAGICYFGSTSSLRIKALYKCASITPNPRKEVFRDLGDPEKENMGEMK